MNNIKFYSTEWCGDCVRSKKLLEKLGITYEEIDIEEITSDYDQQRLYKLIWKRTISSQMADAEIEKTIIKIKSDKSDYKYTAIGEVIIFEGFLKVYLEGTDDENEEEKSVLPKIKEGEELKLDKITSKQMFSRPPSRYTEASLVKKMEELGIGRPATYATTISTIQKRGYVEKGDNEGSDRDYKFLEFSNNEISDQSLKEKTGSNKGRLIPTDIGVIVNDFLVENFRNILDYGFTAEVEKNFDEIASGNEEWSEIIKRFYQDFHSNVTEVNETAERQSGEKILGNDQASEILNFIKIKLFTVILKNYLEMKF